MNKLANEIGYLAAAAAAVVGACAWIGPSPAQYWRAFAILVLGLAFFLDAYPWRLVVDEIERFHARSPNRYKPWWAMHLIDVVAVVAALAALGFALNPFLGERGASSAAILCFLCYAVVIVVYWCLIRFDVRTNGLWERIEATWRDARDRGRNSYSWRTIALYGVVLAVVLAYLLSSFLPWRLYWPRGNPWRWAAFWLCVYITMYALFGPILQRRVLKCFGLVPLLGFLIMFLLLP